MDGAALAMIEVGESGGGWMERDVKKNDDKFHFGMILEMMT